MLTNGYLRAAIAAPALVLVVAGSLGLSLVGCSGSKALTGAALDAHLEGRLKAFQDAMNGDDVEPVVAFFTDDAELSPDGNQTMSGTASVRALMSQSMQQVSNFVLSPREGTESDGEYEQRGRYLGDTGSIEGISGGFRLTWRETEEGEWRIARLAWTQED